MASRKAILGGLAGIVLAGAAGLIGIKLYQSGREQKEYKTEQEEKDPRWQTVEKFDGFTYVSPHKLTRKEVEENLKIPPCSHDDDSYFTEHGLPSPERRKVIAEGLYAGQSIGINRKYDERGTTMVYSIIDENVAHRVLQVEVYPDGSRSIRKTSGKAYNAAEFDKLIEKYSK